MQKFSVRPRSPTRGTAWHQRYVIQTLVASGKMAFVVFAGLNVGRRKRFRLGEGGTVGVVGVTPRRQGVLSDRLRPTRVADPQSNDTAWSLGPAFVCV